MTASELIKRGQRTHNTKGASETIVYWHEDDCVNEELSCFPSNHEYKDEKYGIRKIETVFSQVELSIKPTDRDIVEYDGEEYRVTRWEKQFGFYNIYAEARRSHTGQRMKHQRSGRGVK